MNRWLVFWLFWLEGLIATALCYFFVLPALGPVVDPWWHWALMGAIMSTVLAGGLALLGNW